LRYYTRGALMKVLTLTAFLLYAVSCYPGDKLAEQQLLAIAQHQANLFQKENGPFQLDADFTAQIQVPMKGHLILKWEAADRSWSKIVMGPFEQIAIRDGEKSYIVRNHPYTPVRIAELFNLLRFAQDLDGLAVKKQKMRTEGGVQLTCLEARRESSKEARKHEVCVNAASHDVISDEWQLPPDERRKKQYSEYAEFGSLRYPRKLELFVNGSNAVTAHVTDLAATTPLDPRLLVAPKGAIERRVCEGMKHAVPLKTPEPAYPKSASQNGMIGDTVVSMTVLTDGSVDDIQLMGKSARSMDESTLQTLKSWKFKPAMCGAEPVVSDMEVVVSFRLK
jgi:TonB family protein